MAWTPPGAGDLRESVRFERRIDVSDGIGGVTSTWTTLATVPAKVAPMKGGESVRAARLAGVSNVEITVRSDTTSRSVTPADRAVDARSGQLYNIKWTGKLDERGRFITIIVEAGGHISG